MFPRALDFISMNILWNLFILQQNSMSTRHQFFHEQSKNTLRHISILSHRLKLFEWNNTNVGLPFIIDDHKKYGILPSRFCQSMRDSPYSVFLSCRVLRRIPWCWQCRLVHRRPAQFCLSVYI